MLSKVGLLLEDTCLNFCVSTCCGHQQLQLWEVHSRALETPCFPQKQRLPKMPLLLMFHPSAAPDGLSLIAEFLSPFLSGQEE